MRGAKKSQTGQSCQFVSRASAARFPFTLDANAEAYQDVYLRENVRSVRDQTKCKDESYIRGIPPKIDSRSIGTVIDGAL